MALSKRMKATHEAFDGSKAYAISEAIALLDAMPKIKFKQRIEVAVCLGVDPRKSDQVVRGACLLPHGSGKTVRVAVMAQGPKAEEAEKAGADRVGFDDLVTYIKDNAAGKFDFDVLIATPDAMRLIGQIGRILGPKGMMPNPKVGTVTMNVAQAVKDAKAGQVAFRTDKGGVIHSVVGLEGFASEALQENVEALMAQLRRLKPATAKGTYFKKLVLSSTMGPGIQVDLGSIAAARS